MRSYTLSARRDDAHGSLAGVREAVVTLDTSLSGRADALSPVELLPASLAACIIKGVARAAPLLAFDFTDVSVTLRAERQDSPPKLVAISYVLRVGTEESDHRLELLHTNVRKYGTIANTLADSVALSGEILRG